MGHTVYCLSFINHSVTVGSVSGNTENAINAFKQSACCKYSQFCQRDIYLDAAVKCSSEFAGFRLTF